jgi:hypothetical protein
LTRSVCSFVFGFLLILITGCASTGGFGAQPVSVGMTKEQVIQTVGSANVNLCEKRTRQTAEGSVEQWFLYVDVLGWTWGGGGMNRLVLIELTNGVVTGITSN